MSILKLDIVSAERSLFGGEVEYVLATGESGELGIFPGHTALLTKLKPGQIRIKEAQKDEEVFYISGGILEVQPDVVSVLADTAIRAEDLDEAAAKTAKEHAEKALANQDAGIEYSAAMAELAKAMAQLRAIELLHKR